MNRKNRDEVAPKANDPADPSLLMGLSTETIELDALFADDVSMSGSFDLRRSRLSSIGKLLEVVPIPTLLIDESCGVIFANRACKRIVGERKKLEGSPFSSLFPSAAAGKRAEKLIARVLHNRIPLIAEGLLGMEAAKVLGRIHLRPVRIQKARTVLVLIEDIRAATRDKPDPPIR